MAGLLLAPAVLCAASDTDAEVKRRLAGSPMFVSSPRKEQRAMELLVRLLPQNSGGMDAREKREIAEELIPQRDFLLARCRSDGAFRKAVRVALKKKVAYLLAKAPNGTAFDSVAEKVVDKLVPP